MYESELAAQEMRDKVRSKDDQIDSLVKDLEDARKSASTSGSSRDGKKDSDVRDDIQGRFCRLGQDARYVVAELVVN